MIRTSTILVAALFVAFPATAQTTTNCSAFGDEVTCNTQPNGFYMLGRAIALQRERAKAAEAFRNAVAAGRCDEARAVAMQYGNKKDVAAVEANCVSAQDRAAQADTNLMASISDDVRRGDCQTAKQRALEAGRLDLADQALRVCNPKP